jgi:hypothetical protein
MSKHGGLRWLLIGIVVSAAGCAVVTDALDPNLAGLLGLDPFIGSQGTVIVAFRNATSFPATFNAFEAEVRSADAADLAVGDARNFSLEVDANGIGNEVIQCPVGVFAPGSLGADFAVVAEAAVVNEDGGQQTVDYGGAPLIAGTAFSCGDVIEVRLEATGDNEDLTYTLVVRVIPGG